jgi:MFS family permease
MKKGKREGEDYNHNHSPKLKEHALKTSIKEGTAASIATNLGDAYVIPFALALKAQPIHIGILSSLSGFLYQIAQFFGIKMMEKNSRKKIVLWFVLLQAVLWLFVSLTGYFVWKGWFNGLSIWLLIAFYSLLMFIGGIAYPAWFSWMGDLVPPEKKGEYFSRRNKITNTAGVIAVMLAALLLDYFKTKGLALLAFSALFALAFLFRFISYLLFRRQYAPQFRQKKKDYFSFWAFVKRYDNFGKFAVYHGFFNLAVMVASPFFNVYMLQELKFSYTTFTIATVAYTLFYLLILPIAGKFSDKYGNKHLLAITNAFFVLTPILYIISGNAVWIIIAPQLSAAIANAASVISFTNFTYDAVSQRHRAICVTYTNILIGIGTLVGALIGGILVNYLHPSGISPYIFAFGIAALLRFIVAIYFLPKIKEVRKVKRLPSEYTFFAHPLGFLHAESLKIMHLPEKAFTKFKSLKSLV